MVEIIEDMPEDGKSRKVKMIKEARRYLGYFVLISNEKMDAFTALHLYRMKDVIEYFEDANHSPRIGEILNKQIEIYEALGVKLPTSS